MAYVLEEQVRDVPAWLSDQKFGLWHLLEFAGVLGSLVFMVREHCVFEATFTGLYFHPDTVHDDVATVQ